MNNLILIAITFIFFQSSFGQDITTKIDMVDSNWHVPEDAVFESFDNRKTLVLKSGRATVKNLKFKNGTIEVDVYANTQRSFAGITFRKSNDDMEEVYMRLHKSNQVDAVQYTPIFNNESNWQLFREYQARFSFKNKGWNTLRLEVINNKAEVFINDEKVMSIEHLRTDQNIGEIGLFALFTNRFSNFRVTPKEIAKKADKITESSSTNSSIIRTWDITKAKPYNPEEFNFEEAIKQGFMTVKTEKTGLLPISKYIKKTNLGGNFEQNEKDYTIAKTSITTNKEETKLLSFDYSDNIIVYLNYKPVFIGKNAFRTKGVQYMGHLSMDTNKLYLPLEKGKNIIHCVVIDKANGWGLMARWE